MIVEYFKNNDPKPVYRRFREQGRLTPEGLKFISSWVDDKMEKCFQLMETDNQSLIDEWIINWKDIVDFEIFPVITSKEAVEKITPLL